MASPPTLGFDVGGTNVRGLVLDGSGRDSHHVAELSPAQPRALVAMIASMAGELASSAGLEAPSIGIGCAGTFDASGVVLTSPNLPALEGTPLLDELRKALPGPVVLENDATSASWAEHQLGAGSSHADMALVTLGTGIGTGFVLGGRLHRGASGAAGESGHMVIVADGLACACGHRGCWEAYGSGTAFGRLAREAVEDGRGANILDRAGGQVDMVTSHLVSELAAEGEPEALAVVDELARWVAVGVANLVAVLDPGIVVIGGGVATLGDPLVDAIKSHFERSVIGGAARPPVPIVLAALGSRAGAIGAALLAREAVMVH